MPTRVPPTSRANRPGPKQLISDQEHREAWERRCARATQEKLADPSIEERRRQARHERKARQMAALVKRVQPRALLLGVKVEINPYVSVEILVTCRGHRKVLHTYSAAELNELVEHVWRAANNYQKPKRQA